MGLVPVLLTVTTFSLERPVLPSCCSSLSVVIAVAVALTVALSVALTVAVARLPQMRVKFPALVGWMIAVVAVYLAYVKHALLPLFLHVFVFARAYAFN